MRQLWETLSSRRVALLLFATLGVLSLIGAFVPQGRPAAYYAATYVGWIAKALWVLRLTDVYRAWYFALILVFLGASVVTCSVRRSKLVWRALTARPPHEGAAWQVQEELGPASEEKLKASLTCLPGFRWRRKGNEWYGRRQGIAAAGELVTHAGIVFLLVAGALRSFGHRETVYFFEGNEVLLPSYVGEGYSLTAEKVEEVRDPNTGAIWDYRSRVRLARGGKTVLVRDVEVNRPLNYGGFGLYQSEMDVAGARGLAVSATRLKPGAVAEEFGRAEFSWVVGAKSGKVELAPGQEAPLGDTGYTLLYGDYFEHFLVGEGGITDGNPEYNPAAVVAIRNPRGDVGMGIIFKLRPEYSMMGRSDPTFGAETLNMRFTSDEPDPVGDFHKEFVFAAGSTLLLPGGDELALDMAPGEGDDLRQRRLTARLRRRDGRGEDLELPFAKKVAVRLSDGLYILRFLGARRRPVTGLVVNKDPGLGLFYVGCALLSVGVMGALLLRADELVVRREEGKVVVSGRSSKGGVGFDEDFGRWMKRLRRELG